MNTKRRLLFLLVVLAGAIVMTTPFVFVFLELSLGVRVGDSNVFRDISSPALIALIIGAVTASVFLILLSRSRRT